MVQICPPRTCSFTLYTCTPCGIDFFLKSASSSYLTWVKHRSHRELHRPFLSLYQCVQYFPVSEQWYQYGCLFGILTCTQMLMHVIAHRGCMDTSIFVVGSSGLCCVTFCVMWWHQPSSFNAPVCWQTLMFLRSLSGTGMHSLKLDTQAVADPCIQWNCIFCGFSLFGN